MKTPEQMASEAMDAFTFIDPDPDRDNNDVAEQDFYYIKDQIEAAIDTDRAQRESESRHNHSSQAGLASFTGAIGKTAPPPIQHPQTPKTPKTPAQIAEAVLYGDNPKPLYADPVEQSHLSRMVAAIEIDRAQRGAR